jgi:hypothetical protein
MEMKVGISRSEGLSLPVREPLFGLWKLLDIFSRVLKGDKLAVVNHAAFSRHGRSGDIFSAVQAF